MYELTYGAPTTDLEQIRQTIEEELNIVMVPHDSLYWGEYYLWESGESNWLQLLYNNEPLDNEPFERDHADLGTIIYVTFDEATYDLFHPILSNIPTIQLIHQEAI